ncbi:hypothetical protein ACFS27_03735 [Promicromonospora vindobonensis]|uniref:LPXTG-motif cell wall-anchored protein n=1 Tax=Promicromonospora vindobonensis TaxID=195748 RepID=A0ABW5VR03_9MICO
MKRKFVSRALPSALVAGGLIIAGATSATAADESPNAEQSTGGLGGLLTGTVDSVVGKDGAVDSTLNQVSDTVEQVTKKDGAVDDTVRGVTGVVDSAAGKDGAVEDVVKGVTGSRTSAPSDEVVATKAAPASANSGGPVEDVVNGVTGAVNAVAGENGAVDDVLGADAPEQGVTDNLPSEIIDDIGSIGENVGNADVPGTVGAVAGPDGVVDDLLESPAYASNPGGSNPGGGNPGGDGGWDDGSGDGGWDDGSGDGGTLPIGYPGTGGSGAGTAPVTPIQSAGEAQAPGALAQTGGEVVGAAAAGLVLTAAGAALVRARRRMLEVQS